MKKTQYNVLAVIIAALMLVSLVACGGSKSPIVGKWIPEGGDAFDLDELNMFGVSAGDVYIEFTSGGKVEIMIKDKTMVDFMTEAMKGMGLTDDQIKESGIADMAMTYKTDGDKIKMETKAGQETDTQEGTFKLDGYKLTITIDGEDTVFVKK